MNMKTMMQKSALRTGRTGFRSGLLLCAAVTVGVCMTAIMPVQAASNVGSGGTVTYTDENGLNPSNEPYASGYVVHTFTATGTTNFTVPAVAGSLDIEYLLVGGGGSGGKGFGGGGGAGGLLTNAGGAPLTVAAGTHTVSVGSGGAGVSVDGLGKTGTVSSVFGLTALGGGGGGGYSEGGSGGSGGGAAKNATSFLGGICTPVQGNDGGHAISASAGGGGGGAGGAGGAVTGYVVGGAGGVGLQSSLGGTTNWYAAGGSGVFNATSASSIGGTCPSGGVAAGAGAVNTGSGGGAWSGTGTSGGGGSGIVILRYRYVAEMPLLARVMAPANNAGFYIGTPIMVMALATNDTAPYTVTFYTNANNGAFSQAGEPVTSEPYTLDLGTPPAGTYGIYAVVTTASLSAASPTNTFTVATDNVATGGTITYTDASGLNPRSSEPYNPGYVVHTFTTAGANTLSIPGVADGSGVEYLIVGGGGSGGNNYGGGGGAGGLRTNLGGTPFEVSAGTHAIIVGAGGLGVSTSGSGNSGKASAAFSLKANGGGGGGGGGGSIAGTPGGSGGGSSGGASYGLGNAGYGYRGGAASAYASSGGGGAGAVGGASLGGNASIHNGGAGGVGLQSSISGSLNWYAAGGSGVWNATSASAIGGTCQSGVQAGSGAANTGSGGGGNTGTGTYSGAGGAGIVIVRYPYVYVSGETVSLPSFSPPAGGFIGATDVTLSCMTVDAVIHYTTDGSTPTSASPVYSSAIEIPVDTNVTIKAIGVKDGYADSEVASATYYTGSSGTWTNPSGGSWPSVGNWLHGIVAQGRGVPVFFDTLTLAANTAVTLDGARTVGSLAFADVGNLYDWTLNTGIPESVSLTLDAATTPEISVSNRTATMGVVLAGTNGIAKTGDGTLVLHELNTFSGGVTVNGGTLDWQNAPNASAGTITVNAGATAKFHGTYANFGYVVANALAGNGAITAKSSIGTGGPGNGTGYITFSGDLSGFTGTLTLDTTVNYAQLGGAAIPDGSGAKWIVNRTSGAYYLSVGGAGTYKLGELSGNGALGAYYLGGTTLWEIGALGTDSTYEGVITNGVSSLGVAALRKVGTGKLTLTQASAYSGGTVVSNGVLEVGVNASLGTNKVEVTGGKLVLLGSSAIHDNAQLYLPDGSDKLELATGVDETVRELYLNGKPAFQGKWGRVGSAWYQTPSITGDGILTVTEGPKGGTLVSFF